MACHSLGGSFLVDRMENNCMAAALKPSLRRELSKMKPENFFDDDHPLLSFDTPNGTEDYLSVDCFLDFPVGYEGEEGEDEEEEEKDSLSLSVSSPEDNNSNISSASFLSTELAVPDDDLAELEWVSHFVDDSSSCELSLLVPSNKLERAENQMKRLEREPYSLALRGASAANVLFPYQVPSHLPYLPRLPIHFPRLPRSKRARPTSQTGTWSAGSPPSESSSLSSTASNSFPTPCLIPSGAVVQPIDSAQSFDQPPAKRPKKGRPVRADGETGSTQFQRRCSHCQVQKTPQWRTGPLGPKTLCNACGVRYKSGRLFPEYRPACSPTFSSDIHSNSHRKVLEMRKRKEGSGFSQMVPSF